MLETRQAVRARVIHCPELQSVKIDEVGLAKGEPHSLDFFSAERNKYGSNVKFTTTLKLEPIIE